MASCRRTIFASAVSDGTDSGVGLGVIGGNGGNMVVVLRRQEGGRSLAGGGQSWGNGLGFQEVGRWLGHQGEMRKLGQLDLVAWHELVTN